MYVIVILHTDSQNGRNMQQMTNENHSDLRVVFELTVNTDTNKHSRMKVTQSDL